LYLPKAHTAKPKIPCRTAHAHKGRVPGNIAVTASAEADIAAAPKTNVTMRRYTPKYIVAHLPSDFHPSRMVRPEARYHRPRPSERTNFRTEPMMIAQIKTVPKFVPADNEETMSPAPTPVAATTRPGPTNFKLPMKLRGTCS
jgi:hypothetical protein